MKTVVHIVELGTVYGFITDIKVLERFTDLFFLNMTAVHYSCLQLSVLPSSYTHNLASLWLSIE